MNKSKIVAWGIIGLTIFSVSYALAETADELQKKYNESQQNIINNKSELEKVESEQNGILRQVEELDSQVEIIQIEIDKLNIKIAEYQQIIDEKNIQIEEITKTLNEKKEILKTKLRMMYEMGDKQFFYVFLESKDLFEFLSKYAIVEQIAEYDDKIINEILQIKEELDEAKAILEKSQSEVESARQIQLSNRAELDTKIAEKQKYMKQLESKADTLEALIDKEQEEANRIIAQIKNLQNGSKVYIGGKFLWPTTGTSISSYFGYRMHPILKVYKGHAGIDIAVASGEPIYAVNSGKVIYSGVNGGYGKCVMVDHGGGIVSLYGHASELLVSVGQEVTTGDVIAKIGSTGLSTGPHLHFEVRENGVAVDPLTYLQ